MAEDKDAEHRAESSSQIEQDSVPTYTPIAAATSTIPAYTPVQSALPPTQHTFARQDLVVTFRSYAPDSRSTPLFVNSAAVAGTVALTLAKRETVKEVSIRILGFRQISSLSPEGFNSVGRDSAGVVKEPFWETTIVLWPDPSSSLARQDVKLTAGNHTWPFHFMMPQTFRRGKTGPEYNLPPSFSHSTLPEFLRYAMFIRIERGFMKSDHLLEIPFRYLPFLNPDSPMSHLRRIAYREGTPLPGPAIDPDGYETTNVMITGKLFDRKLTSVELRISLAKPLQYPHDTPIPFFLTFIAHAVPPLDQDQDAQVQAQALDLLSAPQSICATLQRIFSIGSEPTRGGTTSHEVAVARLWRTRDDDDTLRHCLEGGHLSRTLQGEIPVTISLTPGFLFPTIRLGYAVNIAIPAPGFKITSPAPSSSSLVPNPPCTIISLPVKITHNTSAPNGDRTSYAPAPAYDSPEAPPDARTNLGLQVPLFPSLSVIPVTSGAG